jgi:CheY-like chemotaxis protein
MPGMDGDALARIMQNDRGLAGAKVILMTSNRIVGHQRGIAGTLAKPIRRSELLETIRSVLGQPPSAEPTSMAGPTACFPEQARVLLVEDNPTNQLVALAILKKLGVQANSAANGKEAIASLRANRYDLVLMDVQMPEMDGMEATRIIRSGEGAVLDAKIPIIAMTANAMQGDHESCLAAGMDDYLAKPVTPAALATMLNRWLNRSVEQIDSGGGLASPEAMARTLSGIPSVTDPAHSAKSQQ